MTFSEAFEIIEEGFNEWKNKEHNKRWWKKIDGTPIPNDLKVNIAMAFAKRDKSNSFSEPSNV